MDTELERPQWRFTLNYRLHSRLQLGVEYNPVASEVGPLFSLFLLTETERWPALFLGTSSDRIGSPAGKQSYFLTASKRLPRIPISVYGSLNYSEWDNRLNFPFGATLDIRKGFSTRYMFDGDRSHLMLNHSLVQHNLSLIYVWLERFGLSVSTGF